MKVNTDQIAKLQKAAKNAAQLSYSPYSQYRVGASVLTDIGIFIGANIENACSALGICAEQVAISNAKINGCTKILALAVHCLDANIDDNNNSNETMPCGACRQWLAELAPEAIIVTNGTDKLMTVDELIPNPFQLLRKKS